MAKKRGQKEGDLQSALQLGAEAGRAFLKEGRAAVKGTRSLIQQFTKSNPNTWSTSAREAFLDAWYETSQSTFDEVFSGFNGQGLTMILWLKSFRRGVFDRVLRKTSFPQAVKSISFGKEDLRRL